MRQVLTLPSGESLKSYCKANGLCYPTMWQRIFKHGMTVEQAISKPIDRVRSNKASDPRQQFLLKCRKAKVNPSLVMQRHKLSGEPIEKSIKWYERRNECLKTLRY